MTRITPEDGINVRNAVWRRILELDRRIEADERERSLLRFAYDQMEKTIGLDNSIVAVNRVISNESGVLR